ncbi:MAG: HAD-IIIA family hydrolase [Ferrovum sp.]|nr:HAD-IIIA family hydrolase [Ferrovum sp.]NDU87531.1 HAD-IIIA family hydrolase [Ferrovum sp.]
MIELTQKELAHRARSIRLVAFDVDGILTNGALTFTERGEEIKNFHARDGLGLKLLQNSGLILALITGRRSPVVTLRAQELGISLVHQGVHDKRKVAEEILGELGLHWEQMAYMGDDLPDLSTLRRCGLALTVPEAPPEIRAVAHWLSPVGGGHGAARAAAAWLLAARGEWEDTVARWVD